MALQKSHKVSPLTYRLRVLKATNYPNVYD